MARKRQRIYFLYDGGWVYEWETKYLDENEYDHRSFTILTENGNDKKTQMK